MADMADDKGDLEQFLKKVDDIQSLIGNLTSATEPDGDQYVEALANADDYLSKLKLSDQSTGINSTLINKSALKDDSPATQDPSLAPSMDKDSFMAVMETDARERTTRRKARETEANRLKELGNVEFRNGSYDKAITYYTQALDEVRDVAALWTNRAQARIQLGLFQDALLDCDWAIKVNDRCLKAYIHKGKAYLGLGRYDDAREIFKSAAAIDPSKEKTIAGYLLQVDQAQRKAEQETTAQELFDSGDAQAQGVVGLLDKINNPDFPPIYYSGGLRLLRDCLTNTTEKTLFRTSDGFHLATNHSLIAKCFAASPRSVGREEVDVCATGLEVLCAACTDNDENQIHLLDHTLLVSQLPRFLKSKCSVSEPIKRSGLKLLHAVVKSESGRRHLVTKADVISLTGALCSCVADTHTGPTAVSVLNNLALVPKFRLGLRNSVETDVLPTLNTVLASRDGRTAALYISMVTNLCSDSVLLSQIKKSETVWSSLSTALVSGKIEDQSREEVEFLHSLFGLLLNLTLESSEMSRRGSDVLCSRCLEILRAPSADVSCHDDVAIVDSHVRQRACGLLARLLVHSSDVTTRLCEQDLTVTLLEILKSGCVQTRKDALKCLTACTRHSEVAKTQVIETDKGLKAVYDLLRDKDESVFGNAALCLSHLADAKKVCSALARTNVLQDLLVLARDGRRPAVQHNCAILIGKLAQADPRHLERLRELGGLPILIDVMKHVKE